MRPFLPRALLNRQRDETTAIDSATTTTTTKTVTTMASTAPTSTSATSSALMKGCDSSDNDIAECDFVGSSSSCSYSPANDDDDDGGDESSSRRRRGSIVHSVSPDGAMHHPAYLMSGERWGGAAGGGGGTYDDDDDEEEDQGGNELDEDDDDDEEDDANDDPVPPLLPPSSPSHPSSSSFADFFLPRRSGVPPPPPPPEILSPIKKQRRGSDGTTGGMDDVGYYDEDDVEDRPRPSHRPRCGRDDPLSGSSARCSADGKGSTKDVDAAAGGGGEGDATITPPSSYSGNLSFSTPPPIFASSRYWSSPPRRLVDEDGGGGERDDDSSSPSPSSSRRRQHPRNPEQPQRRRQRPYHHHRAPSSSNDAATTSSDNQDPFTPRGRRMMQELSIGGVGGLDTSQSSASSSHRSGGGVVRVGRTWPSSSTTIVPTFRLTTTAAARGAAECNASNDAHSTIKSAFAFPSPGRTLGIDVPPPPSLSSSFSIGESCHGSVVSCATNATSLCHAFTTPQPTPKRPPQHSSPNRASRTTTPIGRQRGSVFRIPPPRLTPQHAIVHPHVATSWSLTPPISDGCPLSSNRAYWSSPQSSLASTVSTCTSRLVPVTVLSRDGSPVVHPYSARPSPSGSSPLMRSLEKAMAPRTPTMLPSLRHRDGSDAGSTPGRGHPNATGLPLPKIRLTPRGGGHGGSLLVDSPIVPLDEEYDRKDDDAHPRWLLPTLPTKFSPIPPSSGMDRTSFAPATSLSSFGMGDEDVMAEMDSLLNGFGHHESSFDRGPCSDLLPRGSPPGGRAGPSRRSAEGGEGGGGIDRVESEEAEMVALLTQGPPSPRKNHHSHRSRPMPSITLNLETIEGSGGKRKLSLSKSPSFLPRPVPVVLGGTRSLFDTTKDPIEGILLADAIAEAAKSNEPLTDDEGSEFEGNHSDFLLSLPLAEQKGLDSIVAPPSSAPSLNPRQAETTQLATMKKRYFFRPRLPSVDSPDFLGDPWDAIVNHAPLVAAAQEGLNKRAFSDAARQDSLSVPSSMELATSVPKYSRPNANDFDAIAPMGMSRPSTSAAACSLLSMSSLCGLNIVHETSDHNFRRHASTPPLPPSESSEFARAGHTLFRCDFSANSLGFSVDSNDGCVYQRDLFTPPISMD